jgi:hypothetical protein
VLVDRSVGSAARLPEHADHMHFFVSSVPDGLWRGFTISILGHEFSSQALEH